MKDELTEAAREFIANEIKDAPVSVIIQFSDLTTRICADFARQNAAAEVRRRELEIAGELERIYEIEPVENLLIALLKFTEGLQAQGDK